MQQNVYGEPLKLCSMNPLTGYNRSGYCTLDASDAGTHVICALITEEFLRFTYTRGNDLITPRGGFPGLKPGDKWCVCALRWLEAYKAGKAPRVDLDATKMQALNYVDAHILKMYAL